MINEQYNYDDNFFRMVSVSLIKTLTNTITWINYFSDKKIRVVVPFYLALAGNDKFALDAFVDDIPSSRIELNTDQIPRGIITFNSFSTDTSQFANPNQYLRNKREINGKLKTLIQKTKAVPVTINYDIDITLNTEMDTLKVSEKLLNTLFNYMFFNLDYYGIKIDAVFALPDDKDITIERDLNMDSDTKKHVKFSLKVDTYYPIFLIENNKFIDMDDFIICDNDKDIDWSRMYKKNPAELGEEEISTAKRVYWKNYIMDDKMQESSTVVIPPPIPTSENDYVEDGDVNNYFR